MIFKICKIFVPNINPRFSRINPLQLIIQFFRYYYNERIRRIAMYSNIFGPLMAKRIRPILYRKLGCKIGKNVYIGREVLIDPRWARMVFIDDHVTLTDRCTLIAHKRNMKDYSRGDWLMEKPHIVSPIRLMKKSHIGVGSIIMPGVTVGEGAVIGSGSVVTKDIPDYTIAVGNPARIIKEV